MRWSCRPNTALVWIIVFLAPWDFNASTSGQLPATQPSTSSSNGVPAPVQPGLNEPALNDPMRRWFSRLADADPKVRDQARVDLMGLNVEDLPKLRQLVIDHKPIAPAQSAALYNIVIHIVLASTKYDVNGGQTTVAGDQPPFFLGVRWPRLNEYNERLGVVVDECLPGFPSFRYLRPGDMILAVILDPSMPVVKEPELNNPNRQTHLRFDLIDAIQGRPDIQNIVLLVLRDGEEKRIAIKMAPKPSVAQMGSPEALDGLIIPHLRAADAYWQENFAPLLDGRYARAQVE